MKKRIISLLLASAMLLSLTSCKKEELNYAEMTLDEYIDKVKLPENLTISIDPATVEERETAKVYENVALLDLDDTILQELLLRNPVTKEDEYEVGGMVYRAETDTQSETLSADEGSLSYLFQPNKAVNDMVINLTQPIYPQMYYYGNGKEINVFGGLFAGADRELDFASRAEIKEQAEAFLEKAGISAEIHEIVANDLAVLQPEYELQKRLYEKLYANIAEKAAAGGTTEAELLATLSPEYEVPVPQKSDENYNVLFRPLLDGVPICTYELTSPMDSLWYSICCSIQYTEDGIMDVSGYGFVDPAAEGTETEIISAAEALELAKDYYTQGILLKPYNIEEIELVYIEYWNEELTEMALIRPYWLVKASYQQDYPKSTDWEGNPLEGEVKAYDHLYFDAVTGEYFEGSTSGKPYD